MKKPYVIPYSVCRVSSWSLNTEIFQSRGQEIVVKLQHLSVQKIEDRSGEERRGEDIREDRRGEGEDIRYKRRGDGKIEGEIV